MFRDYKKMSTPGEERGRDEHTELPDTVGNTGNDQRQTTDTDTTKDDRTTRFGEEDDIKEVSKSKNMNDLRPYYSGSFVDERMAAIRKAIVHIRDKWEDYDAFMASLKQLVDEKEFRFQDERATSIADRVFSSRKTWNDKNSDMTNENFDLIRMYTTLEGFRFVFRVINSIFRQDDAILSQEKINAAVFLVELINIDLFNYCLKYPNFNNFQGIVFRGMAVSQKEMEYYEVLRHQPIGNRYIGIPLGLWSATSDINVAKKFVGSQLQKQEKSEDKSQALEPLLMKIHVIEMDQDHLSFYRNKFPTSVVSTICAVDIAGLSSFPNEKEVLLRGPFFQVLHIYENGEIGDKPCREIEMMMLNTNRDHLNAFLGEQDAAARAMFGTMIGVTRCRFAVKYCKEKDLLDDLEAYSKLLKEKEAQLEELMK